MRLTVTLVADMADTADVATNEDAAIEASSATAVWEILARLGDLVGVPPDAIALIDGHAVDDARAMSPLGSSALREGAIVSFATARPHHLTHADSHPAPPGYLELQVVGGPAAGSIHKLSVGVTPIGRDSISGIRIDDPAVSRRHAVLTVTAAGITVCDACSRNGTTLDGASVDAEPVPIRPGMRLRVGESTLIIAAPDDPRVTVTSTTDGRLSFNRPPRLDAPDPAAARATVTFPAELVDRAPNRLPIIALLAPLIAGVALAAVMRRPEYLLFTMLSPVMIASQWVSDRLGHRKSDRSDRAAYAVSLSRANVALTAAVSRDAGARREQAPDPAALMKTVGAPSGRLWERRREDADFLVLRLGLGTLIASVGVTGTQSGVPITAPPVSDVPVTVTLPAIGILGIAGSLQSTAALARALVGQLAALHSPRDVAVVLLTEPARVASWAWVRWLPHLRPVSDLNCQALLGLDAPSASSRVAELSALITARTTADTEGRAGSERAIVVIVDGAQALRRTPALTHVLAHGPRVGVYAMCIDDEELRLPEECGAVALLTDAVGNRMCLRTSGGATIVDVIADGVSVAWADHLARALAPLRDDSPDRSDALPDGLRWLDLAGSADIAADLRTRWRNAGAGTTAVLVGAATDGKFVLDIARDGPHALIAGTTGSGKSELLQTLVASLAMANRPDDLTFVLVDYKGGAAFGACATLPHTVGMVTDLDGRLVERALTSLGAELKRREALLATVGAPDIAAFRAAGGELARLVIVVDEFASLAEELPTFVGGLVGIAQRGRSLGVHLVLATQRPEGVVSADIRANTNLRICLAVMRDSDSRDVIDAPDAARINRTTPGRGYARTGHSELIAFQSGRVGGRSTASDEGEINVQLSPFRALCEPAPARGERTSPNDSAETDLDCIVTACRDAARSLGITTAPSPWLPPLPDVIAAGVAASLPFTAVLGVLDLPAAQARQNYLIDLATLGHQVIAGSARSGRTTALRTLIGGLATSTPCDQLHVYAVDCSGGSLGALSALPQCGAVVSTLEPARVLRLFRMLTTELDRRQATATIPGHAGTAAQPVPHIVVVIDGWESFTSAFEDLDAGAVVDACTRLLREGASVGFHVVVTADRAGLVGRLASIIENRLVLRLADRTDFSLIGLPVKEVPLAMPPGRGFLADSLLEMQVCVLGHDPSAPAQLAALAAIATATQLRDADVPRSRRPRRVDPLPAAIAAADIEAPPGVATPGSALVTLGVGGDELSAVLVDLLDAGPGFVVAGPHRSGRSTALATIADALRSTGWQVVAVSPRRSILSDHADHVVESHRPGLDELLAHLDGRLAVMVDDAELITDSPAAGVLDRFIRTARDAGHIVVIAGSIDELAIGFRGFLVDARRARSGILLNPRSALDGEVLGVRLPRSTGGTGGLGGTAPPGRGQLVVRGSITHLQVALPSPPRSSALPGPTGQPQTVTVKVPIAAPPCITVTLTTPSAAPV